LGFATSGAFRIVKRGRDGIGEIGPERAVVGPVPVFRRFVLGKGFPFDLKRVATGG